MRANEKNCIGCVKHHSVAKSGVGYYGVSHYCAKAYIETKTENFNNAVEAPDWCPLKETKNDKRPRKRICLRE